MRLRFCLISAFCILHSAFASARVVRVDITSRSDYWNGTYERIQGRVIYALSATDAEFYLATNGLVSAPQRMTA